MFGGIRRYSIYSQAQPCDLLELLVWPVGPSFMTLARNPLALEKSRPWAATLSGLTNLFKNDSHSAYDLAKCRPSHLRIYVFNALAVAASQSRFDERSVQSHVHPNRQDWARGCGCFRNGSLISSSSDGQVSLAPRSFSVLPTFSPSWRDLNHSQSDDVLFALVISIELLRGILHIRAPSM